MQVLLHIGFHQIVVALGIALVHPLDILVAVEGFLVLLVADEADSHIGAVVGDPLQVGQGLQEDQTGSDGA